MKMTQVAKKNEINIPELQPGFSFIVTGRLCPNNLVTRHVGVRAVKSARARKDQARVREIVREAANHAGWKIVGGEGAVGLTITCWNPLGDIDGRQKVIMDAMGPIFGKNLKKSKKNVVIETSHEENEEDVIEPRRELIEQGIIYENDSRVKRLLVVDNLDHSGPRYEIYIESIPVPVRGPKIRNLKFEDLTDQDRKNLLEYYDMVLDPKLLNEKKVLLNPLPGIAHPLLVEFAPENWVERARKSRSMEPVS